MIDYADKRHGSAGFADARMRMQAGLYCATSGLYIGHDERRRWMGSDQQAAVLLVGGARSNKGDHIIPWLVDGRYPDHIVSMDPKAQNGPIAQLQVAQGRRVINSDPRGRSGLPAHRINPTSYLRADSPTLFPDGKLFAANWLPLSGSPNGRFFEANAQRWVEAATVTLARVDGVVTLPRLADLMGQIGQLTDDWLAFEERMAGMPEPSILQVVAELQAMRESSNPNAGGAAGIKGEIAKAFAALSDPQLREAVSAPFDFCFSELSAPGAPSYLVNIMEAQEFAQTSAPVIKALYTGAMIYKRRAQRSRRQLWLLDEVGNIGAWPLTVDLATFGAGYGIRPVFVVQSSAQLGNLAPHADQIIPNSCGTQIYKGVRDYGEAETISQMLGMQTIEHEDFQTNERARLENQQAFMAVLNGEADPVQTGFAMAQREASLRYQTKAPRALLTPDEIMNRPNGTALVFMPGVLERPTEVWVPNYWKRRDLAGRYLGDPYHSPPGKVELRTFFGQRFRSVITKPVPDRLADWPQYRACGEWSYVKGHRPR
ncbi:type IV secretory system conjugative DNA transfer family protein [Amorphus orientalis]|uniref:Type IV secretion system protein VirD4 n=1 Tax=Amorphus orientalis TaxID=649198 RepID=A0AAE3VMX6_9HYPH|nr:type IV secretory system conjugative DNA transfer family protein [Amorphus orientalis]MDQ0314616.1 type IV secretion system protein VirD4 [Amorphus orientalis]